MIGTIRKHQTWLWAVIITVTIISFVIFFSPYTRMSNTSRTRARLGSINGEKVTEEAFYQAANEVRLRYFLMTGNWLDEQQMKRDEFDQEIYKWLLIVQEQERLGIETSSDDVAEAAREIIRPLQKSGISSPSVFVQQVLRPRGFQVDDFERYVRHFLGLQQLISTVALSGKLVTPEEAQSLYTREHQERVTEAVFFSASNYLAKVNPAPEAITQFYSNRLAEYRIPERVQVSYVKFDLTNFVAKANEEMAKMTNLDERIEAEYQQRGTNYYRDAKSPAEAKEKIRNDVRKQLMLVAARKQASEFASKVFEKEPQRPENLAAVAQEAGLTVKISEPFDHKDGPKDLEVGPNFVTAAFALSPTNEPFAGPLVGDDGVYVIAFQNQLPSEVPPLDRIRDRVVADYRYAEAVVLARQAGRAFAQTLTNALAHGQSFAAVCSSTNVGPVALPPFSISTRELLEAEEHIDLRQLKEIAFGTPPGKVSDFRITREGGIILFVKSQLPVNQEKMQKELSAFASSLRQTRQNEVFQEWFRKAAERGFREVPAFQPQPQPPGMSSRTRKT